MQIIIVRHADPNYELDTLTDLGDKQALALREVFKDIKPAAVYCSPLGRAKRTLELAMPETEYKVCEWLTEFEGKINSVVNNHDDICWDWMPEYWANDSMYYDIDNWYKTKIIEKGNVKEKYDDVIKGIDDLLDKHGYQRDGLLYKVNKGNHDVVVIFCHFGVMSVILSRIINVSPMVLWHNFVALPSGITILNSEERALGKAIFRISSYSDVSHLRMTNTKISNAARFVECYNEKTDLQV